MTYDELKQDLLDAYKAMEVDLEACIRYSKFLESDSERIKECQKALLDYEKQAAKV